MEKTKEELLIEKIGQLLVDLSYQINELDLDDYSNEIDEAVAAALMTELDKIVLKLDYILGVCS